MSPLPVPQVPQGFAPFEQQVKTPGVAWNAAPLVCIQINETWATYVLGACFALTKRSTWDTTDETELRSVMENATQLMAAIAGLEPCPMIEFRVDTLDPHYWQYSTNGGATWTRQPDTVSHWTPQFTASSAPGGYDISVNGGITNTAIPILTAHQPDAVVTDPLTAIVNTIAPIAGVPGMLIKALNDFALYLESNNISLHLTKASDRGIEDSAPVMEIDAPGTYDFPLMQINAP